MYFLSTSGWCVWEFIPYRHISFVISPIVPLRHTKLYLWFKLSHSEDYIDGISQYYINQPPRKRFYNNISFIFLVPVCYVRSDIYNIFDEICKAFVAWGLSCCGHMFKIFVTDLAPFVQCWSTGTAAFVRWPSAESCGKCKTCNVQNPWMHGTL